MGEVRKREGFLPDTYSDSGMPNTDTKVNEVS